MSETVRAVDNTVLHKMSYTLTAKWDILFDDDSKEMIGFTPKLGDKVYPCYSCRHMFSCLTSLQDHINRRIFVLTYNCPGCRNETFTFYNRCSFLLHTRTHYSLKHGTINLSLIDIFSLPISLAGFLPHPKIPLLYAAEGEEISSEVYVNAQFYVPDKTDRGKKIIHLKCKDIILQKALAIKQVCLDTPKCIFITVEAQKTLRKQINNEVDNGVRNSNSWTDVKGDPDSCLEITSPGILEIEALAAKEVPKITMPVISKVETVRDNTFNLPKCLECNAYQKNTMSEHYLGKNLPSDKTLNCPTCKFIASTKCSLKAHQRIHENRPPFVCPDCGKDFKNWDLLHRHMGDVCFHLAKQVRVRCPGKRCGKLFAASATFCAHFQMHLKSTFICSACDKAFSTKSETETHEKSHVDLCYFRKSYECPLCPLTGLLSEKNYKDHVELHANDTKRCVYVYMCRYCRSYFRSTATYATHLLKCTSRQNVNIRKYDIPKYVTKDCEKCFSKIIFNEKRPTTLCSKCKSQQENSLLVSCQRYFCILCNALIDFEEKNLHIKQCKYSKPYICIKKLPEDLHNFDIINYSPSSPTNTKRQLTDPKTDDSAKKKRKRTPNIVATKKREAQPDLTAEEPVHFDGIYRCKLCDYENSVRLLFHEHIKEHRDISTAYQCMECAECFVVKPSLIKHLLHFHNITDHESYLSENDCFDVDAVKELKDIMKLAPGESKEPVKENQCRVCRREFQDPLSLNKHFRIHGMAFLLKNSK